MKQLLPLLALAVLLFTGCTRQLTEGATAQTGAATPERTYGPTTEDNSLLWKISGKAAKEPSYLFGTIHIIPEDDYFMPDHVVRSLNETDKVYFEIDPREMENPAMLLGLITKINMRGDTSLSDLLSEDEYAVVKDYFSDKGLPFFMVKRMKPMFLSAMVGQEDGGDGGGMGGGMFGGGGLPSGQKSYEFELKDLAEAGDKAIGGLETIEFQMSMFDSIPYGIQASMLVEAIRADDTADSDAMNQMEMMVDMYKRQAVAEMANLMDDPDKKYGNFEEMLLLSRNRNWIPLIEQGVVEGPVFYAVGAGHLGGEGGVIALLRRAGYAVEPVYE